MMVQGQFASGLNGGMQLFVAELAIGRLYWNKILMQCYFECLFSEHLCINQKEKRKYL